MGLSKLFLTLKGGAGSGNHNHRGRPGIRGGSSSKGSLPGFYPISNPQSISQIGSAVKRNLEDFEIKREEKYQEMGFPYKKPEKFDTRVPGVIDPKTGEIIVHGLSGSHNNMSYMGRENWFEQGFQRFGLVFDNDFKTVKEIQVVQGAMGVDFGDKKYADKSMKKVYNTLDKLSKIDGLKGVKVSIETDDLDENYNPKTIHTTI